MSAVAVGTRERLLRSAQELVEEGGYGAATVIAIAERAGVAAGTLYRHWPSKGTAGRSNVKAVQAVLTTFARRALRNPRLAWALIAEPVDPLVDAERIAYRREYARLLGNGLREAIEAEKLPLIALYTRRDFIPE